MSANISDDWKHFSLLHFSNDYFTALGQCAGFVLCCFCKNTLKHNRTTSGTTHLRDHVAHCLKNPSNQLDSRQTTSRPIDAFFKTPKQLSQSDQKKLLDALIVYIARDIRPFNVIEDPGFRNMAACFVSLGTKCGRFDINKALPSQHTVK